MKRVIIGIFFALVAALAIGWRTPLSSNQARDASQPAQRSKLQEKLKEKVGKPTPVQEGVMSDKQRRHSKLFKRFELTTGGRKLRDMVGGKDEIYLVKEVPDAMTKSNFNLNSYLMALACQADTIFLATVSSKTSQLLDEGTFTFTDYEVRIDEILKNNPAFTIQTNDLVTYTSPGGSIELKGTVINAVDYRSEPLQIGEEYVFYATFIQETRSYKGMSSSINADTFQIKSGVVTQASEKPFPLGSRTANSDQFMATARAALYGPCAKRQ